MTDVVEVPTDDPRVAALRAAMGDEMADLYGRPRHGATAEQIDPATVAVTVLATSDAGEPVGTAALRRVGVDVEVKRMYVVPGARGTGLAGRLLDVMEEHAVRLGAERILLHTGERQTAALALYRRRGYREVPVFEPYLDVPESVCFARPARSA